MITEEVVSLMIEREDLICPKQLIK